MSSKSGAAKKKQKKSFASRVGAQLDDFFGIDLRTLAVVRIVAAITVLWTLTILYPDIVPFFTDDGVYPRSYWVESRNNPFYYSLHVVRGEVWWQYLLFGIHATAGLMLLVGYKTRLAALVVWVLLVSLFNRNPPLVHRGDTLLCLLVFWGMLTPWGARFSVDGALNTVRELPKRLTSFATAGLILQMPILYLSSVFLKMGDGSWHTELTAVFYSLSPEYVTVIGQFLAENQPFIITQALTIYTVVVESAGPILMFFPLLIFVSRETRQRWLDRLRLGAIAGLSALQLGLAVTVAVGLFPLISTVGMLAAIPTSIWERWEKSNRVQKASKLVIFYDPDCGFCKKMVLMIREFLLPGATKVLPASDEPKLYKRMQKNNSWIIRDPEGNLHERYDGFLTILRHSPWAYILHGPAQLLRPVGNPVYRLVAANRPLMGRLTRDLDYGAYHIRPSVIGSLIAALVLAGSVASNVDSITDDRLLPREMRQFQSGFRIHQNWRMFVVPIRWSSHHVIHATLRDGTEVDLFGGRGPITPEGVKELTWEQPYPQRSRSFYSNYRWRLYFQTIRRSSRMEDRRHYASYVCRSWNQQHSGDERVDRFRFYRMVQTRDLLHEPIAEESEKRFLWRHWCFGRPDNDEDDD